MEDEAVAQALFDAARRWLGPRGVTVMRGPFNPSTNDMCGLLVDGFQYPPRIMMPYNPSYYPRLFERAGLRSTRELLAYEVQIPPSLPEAIRRVAETARRRGVRV
ncbi:MAG: N-acetyltransferase, partial [Nanoarchaeota archaeon]